MNNKPTSIQVD